MAMTFKFFSQRRAFLAPLVCFSLIFPPSLGEAADPEGNFAIKGGGLQSCSAFIDAYDTQSPDLKLYAGWMDGYVTGINQYSNQTYDLTPWQNADTLLFLTKSVCAQLPEDKRVFDAFIQLVQLLAPGRLDEEAKLVALVRGDNGLAIYDAVLKVAKQRLKSKGLYQGAIDNSFTEETALVFEIYQEDKGLPVTGLPDQRTLFTLMRDQ